MRFRTLVRALAVSKLFSKETAGPVATNPNNANVAAGSTENAASVGLVRLLAECAALTSYNRGVLP